MGDQATPQRGDRSTFVGHARELAALNAALTQTAAGNGRVVMLVGDAGIGKTRTAAEFAAHARATGALVLRGACYDGEWAPPYGPFVEALTGYVRATDPGQLRDELGFGAAPLARVVPAIRERLPDVAEPVALQPDEERVRLFDAVSQFLIAIARRCPAVLLLDDLHWAERGTVALLRHVARSFPAHRLLLVGAHRDGEVDPGHPLAELLGLLSRESTYERVLLKGLAQPEAEALVTHLSAGHLTPWVVSEIQRRSEGNPFFIREMVQHLVEEDLPVNEHTLSRLPVSEGIRRVIERRLLRLPADVNQLLRVASAFDVPFRYDVAAVVAGVHGDAAMAAIDAALAAHLIAPTAHADSYDFSHALIRHTLYSGWSPSRRIRLHRDVAQAMEGMDRASEHAAEIARQYHRSRDLPGAERGIPHALAAADRAAASYDYDAVASQLRLALDLLPEVDSRRPRLLARLGSTLAWACSFDEASDVIGEAATCIAAAEGQRAAAEYIAEALIPMWEGGAVYAAIALAQQGLRYVGPTQRDATWASLMAMDILRQETEQISASGIWFDSPERREVSRIFSALCSEGRSIDEVVPEHAKTSVMFSTHEDLERLEWWWELGHYRRSLSSLGQKARDYELGGRFGQAASMWALIFRLHTALGEFGMAKAARSRSIELVTRLPTPPWGAVHLIAGEDEWRMARDEDWGSPMEMFRYMPLREGPPSGWVGVVGTAADARVFARLGKIDHARRRLAALLPTIESTPAWVGSYVRIVCDAAETMWLCPTTDGIDVVERNLRTKVVEPDFHHPMADGRLALARLCSLRHRYDEAGEWFARARIVLDEQGARPLRAIVDYDEGLMYVRRGATGDGERAAPLLDAALHQFRAIGMPGWIRRAESLLRDGREWSPAAPVAADQAPDRPGSTHDGGTPRIPLQPAAPATEAEATTTTSLFRKDGDYWTITYRGAAVKLRDGKGLQYLAQLLRHAGQEFLALDLALGPAAADQDGARPTSDARSAAARPESAAPILDGPAQASYRRRLEELRDELVEAERNHDIGRTGQIRGEMEMLAAELRGALGIGGRDRRAADNFERARSAVGKRIRSEIKRISTVHPSLGRHLHATVTTGYYCGYHPERDVLVRWEL